ncbi:hypothetical protein AOL_s00043g821 [Orbilia oligospora ATCC 24927]|uniref:Uncharacterized protein n=1 Tax=Arthrobotrys oligospora (strain ATCC 24927 / CBS 115.81 / DSM 1491) TaxID=756982 RepID=G1X547_ARTOA|nr:hypothetical protein AOL_s00043g821 [Orbilia oligospora ATCC 24927]EGX51802.1 hypothetical protein AOL_s00043g821 [Orbilia oligospora ATCC 24927]
MSLNPNSATRREFSEHFIAARPPSGADAEYIAVFQATQHLLSLLINHAGMVETENAQQPFMEPAKSKNRVYAMWDFVGRTMGILLNNVRSYSNPGRSQDEAWRDAVGRSQLADMLLQDESRGDSMHRMTWGSGFDARFPFGDEIKQASTAVVNAIA